MPVPCRALLPSLCFAQRSTLEDSGTAIEDRRSSGQLVITFEHIETPILQVVRLRLQAPSQAYFAIYICAYIRKLMHSTVFSWLGIKDLYKAVLKPCQIYGNQEKLPVKDHDILLQSFGEELSTSPAQSQ
jgi:hypothetical protein